MIKLYYSYKKHNSEDFIKESLRRFSGKNDFIIARNENGKPYIKDENLFFSLSHTDSFIICGVSDNAVGVDAEKIRSIKNKEKILGKFTGENVQNITDAEFIEKWTAFESRVKYFGERLSLCPRAKSIPVNVKIISFDGYTASVCSEKEEQIEKERINMAVLNRADILLPNTEDLTKWSVVACDQYTSQPEYWQSVAQIAGDCPSTLNLVYPEAFLSEGDSRIEKINSKMQEYCEKGLFCEYKNCFIYVERTLSGGRVRKGIIGSVDLEDYDFHKGVKSKIRATEGTVLERIPPRVKIRENAPLELPHVMLLVDDKNKTLIEQVKKGEKLYDFELMKDGGHLAGWIVSGDAAQEFSDKLEKFAAAAPDGLVLAVGDGNHSLATAKTCWDNIKDSLSDEEKLNHPARFCLVEVENIHDDVLEFEPIHRVVFNVGSKEEFVNKLICDLNCSETDNGGQHIVLVSDGVKKDLYIGNISSPLEVGTLQKYLDEINAEVDYIHGEDVTTQLSCKDGAVGFLLPKPEKSSLFETVIKDGALPRKTFSMGEANEKRYYMEAKKIK